MLDTGNKEFNAALNFVSSTNNSLFLTGKAGTGKTTFIRYIREHFTKKMVVLAPTGVAAYNAGGQTIHSFFHIEPRVYVPGEKCLRTRAPYNDTDKTTIYEKFKYNKSKQELLKNIELLVIDEISMVRSDLLDVIDRLLQVFRADNRPFGGVQVLLVGDPFQLIPVVKPDARNILKRHYTSPFFFNSKVYERLKPVHIELKKIYRQTDAAFIGLLNKVRVNHINEGDLDAINARYNPQFLPGADDNAITIATHNSKADAYNRTRLDTLDFPLFNFEAALTGELRRNEYPADFALGLKVGAQVMFIKNDTNDRYFNGKIGTVCELNDSSIAVKLPEGNVITVEKYTWYNIRYSWNAKEKRVEEEVLGSFTQYPIRLAWAITVHKSQGLTFDRAVLDVNEAFTAGQVYVALSRCRSLDGLILKTKISRSAIFADERVLEFGKSVTPNDILQKEYAAGKADYLYKQARDNFKKLNFETAFEMLKQAMTLRNDMAGDLFKRWYDVITKRYLVPQKPQAQPEISVEEAESDADVILGAGEKIVQGKRKKIELLTDRDGNGFANPVYK